MITRPSKTARFRASVQEATNLSAVPHESLWSVGDKSKWAHRQRRQWIWRLNGWWSGNFYAYGMFSFSNEVHRTAEGSSNVFSIQLALPLSPLDRLRGNLGVSTGSSLFSVYLIARFLASQSVKINQLSQNLRINSFEIRTAIVLKNRFMHTYKLLPCILFTESRRFPPLAGGTFNSTGTGRLYFIAHCGLRLFSRWRGDGVRRRLNAAQVCLNLRGGSMLVQGKWLAISAAKDHPQ